MPPGEWLCKRCRVFEKTDCDEVVSTIKHNQKENINGYKHQATLLETTENEACESKTASPKSMESGEIETTHSQNSDEQGNADQDKNMLEMMTERGETRSTEFKEASPDDTDSEKQLDDVESDDSVKSPIDLLIRAANVLNPKQFQLPLEYTPPYLFPGTSKKPYLNPFTGQLLVNANNRNGNKKLPHELDNGLVFLPIKVCFRCGRSCRKTPLIQCDYCPLLFHADCLNPPLTGLPIARWMCPHHVEPVLEGKLLKSVSLSERVKLWEKYTGKVNSEMVKLEFLKKNQRKNPMFRLKESIELADKVKVPESVKQMYRNPPYELIHDLKIDSNESAGAKLDVQIKYDKPTEEEQNLWLDSIASMQNEYAERLIRKQIKNESIGQSQAAAQKDDEQAQLLNQLASLDDLSKLDEKWIRILAMQRLQQLLRPSNLAESASSTPGDKLTQPQSPHIPLSSLTPIDLNIKAHSPIESANHDDVVKSNNYEFTKLNDKSNRHAYAVLCPLHSSTITGRDAASVAMFGNVMSIGRDGATILNLTRYSNCKYISDQHACIFLDQVNFYALYFCSLLI